MIVRVAATQFAIGTDLEENLDICRRMIARAHDEGAELIVLPEFCNHPSWYDDTAHAQSVAVAPGDAWLTGIADAAKGAGAWVMVNATRLAKDGRVFGSNFLYGPSGTLAAVTDKQVLMGGESIHISHGEAEGPLVATPFGKVGLYSCMDGVINETPRVLALRGAQILCNSLNSFASDEATLHIPVRAAENRVFVVAANKVGPLIPPHAVTEVATRMGIPESFLHGAGESQVVGPDGKPLAMGPATGEAVVVADIDPTIAGDKLRPDRTDRFAVRRPALYAAIGAPPKGRVAPPAAATIEAATIQSSEDSPEVLAGLVRDAGAAGATLIVLPELAGLAAGAVDDVDVAVEVGANLVRALVEALAGTDAVAVTSVAERVDGEVAHVGVAIGASGVVHRQLQLHAVARHGWVEVLGASIGTTSLPWGALAIVVGDDHIHPESTRLAALAEADVVAVPFDAQEGWETQTGLVERSAENRVCLVATTRPHRAGSSLLCSLERDYTMWTEWEERAFDGRISHPLLTRAEGGPSVTQTTLHPAAAANRVLTRATDVVDSRPWNLVEAITSEDPGVWS